MHWKKSQEYYRKPHCNIWKKNQKQCAVAYLVVGQAMVKIAKRFSVVFPHFYV
jgi:hypothetical protein